MLGDIWIFLYVQLIFIAIAFWEVHIDPKGWAQNSIGWRLNIGFRTLTAYHFWAWIVMLPMFLFMPLVIYGWNAHLFWILLSAYFMGNVVEDSVWFLINPEFGWKKLNSHHAHWHKWWIKIGKREVPEFYIIFPLISILIWYFFVL